MQDFLADFAMLLLGVISALLILVVLLQRGRGGGLAGAFGGLGGQSAFGTKAGDVFTKITIGLVTAWVLLAGVSGVLARKASEKGDFSDTTTATDDDSEDTGGSMSAVGDSPVEDEDDAAGDDAAGDDTTGDETEDDDAASDDSGDEAAKDDSKPESSEKTEAAAAPADDKGDEDATSSEPETASPDSNE